MTKKERGLFIELLEENDIFAADLLTENDFLPEDQTILFKKEGWSYCSDEKIRNFAIFLLLCTDAEEKLIKVLDYETFNANKNPVCFKFSPELETENLEENVKEEINRSFTDLKNLYHCLAIHELVKDYFGWSIGFYVWGFDYEIAYTDYGEEGKFFTLSRKTEGGNYEIYSSLEVE